MSESQAHCLARVEAASRVVTDRLGAEREARRSIRPSWGLGRGRLHLTALLPLRRLVPDLRSRVDLSQG
jgi:hypothetical protein